MIPHEDSAGHIFATFLDFRHRLGDVKLRAPAPYPL